jgi:hypothetical protein
MTDFPTTYDKNGKEIELGRRVMVPTSIKGRLDIGTIVDVIEGDIEVTNAGQERPREHLYTVEFGPDDTKDYVAVWEDEQFTVKEFEVI